MSYEKLASLDLGTGETVVQLDDGNLVAVSCSTVRNPTSNLLNFTPAARWIDEAGVQRLDAAGRPVTTSLMHQSSADQVATMTTAVVVRECLFLVLGEPLTVDTATSAPVIPWSADLVTQCSIRTAIAAASLSAPVASDVL